jgi:predicted CopG family antitoxin
MHACMATKTISIDLEAYDRLQAARLSPKESFSKVIKRASWGRSDLSAARLLASCEGLPVIDEETLELLERAQAEDPPPEAPWDNG